ncbi:chorismate mutase [Thermosinus carboxydivorans Nor1]|uniref:chorismate mutase n=1 Tax=Thermosinus carboxydivorans Nor1 TaxID=401526 RepID=A1HQ53_9FIRM|nr:chorismate mutase [Thermosinus carboxydivorans Nor1]
MLRGVRGATTVDANTPENIQERVRELLTVLVRENGIDTADIGAVIFSSTPDLNSMYPAAGARILGWTEVPLFGTQEIDNPTGLARCIRVLILWNTDLPQGKIRHVYLHGAAVLRQDINRQ